MANIFARSPFIVEINEASQIETKVELRIWNGTGSAPSSPTYTLSKLIPSTSNRQTTYNISPYIKEFISHDYYASSYTNNNQSILDNEWCNVQVKRYKKLTTSFVLIDTTTYKAYDGWNLYTSGYNYDKGIYLLDQGTYYYSYDALADFSGNGLARPGSVSFECLSGNKIKYSELGTANTYTNTSITAGVKQTYRVYYQYYAKGNKMEILDSSNNVLWTATFKPVIECKYSPVVIDFINKYGAWQREFFFKASKNNVNVTNSAYNLLQSNLVNYDVLEGQRKVFNTVMTETITINSDWRDDAYAETIRDIMMSERILVNNRPAKLNTNNIELQKQINTKMINYTLELQYSTDINNTVV